MVVGIGSGKVRGSAMDLGGLVDFIETVLAIAAVVTLLFCAAGAWRGACYGAARKRKLLAMLCGFLSGVSVAAIVGVGFVGAAHGGPVALALWPVFGPLFGGGMSYVVAQAVAETKPT